LSKRGKIDLLSFSRGFAALFEFFRGFAARFAEKLRFSDEDV
jgi:hypothetical protein